MNNHEDPCIADITTVSFRSPGGDTVYVFPSITGHHLSRSSTKLIPDRRAYQAIHDRLPHEQLGIPNIRGHHINRIISNIVDSKATNSGLYDTTYSKMMYLVMRLLNDTTIPPYDETRDYTNGNIADGERLAQKVARTFDSLIKMSRDSWIVISILPDDVCLACYGGFIGKHCLEYIPEDLEVVQEIIEARNRNSQYASPKTFYQDIDNNPIGVIVNVGWLVEYLLLRAEAAPHSEI